MVVAYSLFKKAQVLYPDAQFYFLTFQKNRYAIDILKILPEANVITIQDRTLISFLASTLVALKTLRAKKIDIVIDLELFARFTALMGYLTKSKQRVGYFKYHNEGLYRGNLLTHKVEYNPHMHMAQNFLSLIHALEAPVAEKPLTKRALDTQELILPQYFANQAEKQKLHEKLEQENPDFDPAKKIIILNSNASDLIPLRRWPMENYIGLANLLLESPDLIIILTGTQSEYQAADTIAKAIGSKRCMNLAGKTTFTELMTLYSMSDILVTNDSGPVHFSSMTDIRTFAFFGPETPKLYGSLAEKSHVFYSHYFCSPCVSAYNHRKSPCTNNLCLQAISVEQVYAEIKPYL